MPAGTKLVDEVTAPVVGVQDARVFMPWAGNQALIPGEQVERKLLFGKVRRPLPSPAAKCQHAQEYWHPDACSCSVTLEFAEKIAQDALGRRPGARSGPAVPGNPNL